MQAARDLSESRKLTLAAGDLVTLVDHRWVAGDGDLKHTQWLFVRMKQRLQSNGCFPVFVSGCQDSEYVMMHSWINLVVSRVAGFVFSKITMYQQTRGMQKKNCQCKKSHGVSS